MSGGRQRPRGSTTRKGRIGWVPIALVVILAVAAVGGLIVLGQREPDRPRIEVATSGNVKGNPNAPVVVETWSDFQCIACQKLALDVEPRLDATVVADGRAQIVYRHFAFLGPESVWAAEATECAGEQGQFWAYHDRLFDAQAGVNRGVFTHANLKRFASELGLDRTQFDACLDSGRYTQKVRADTEAGQAMGVRATPTLFVAGEKIEGVPPFEALRQFVETVALSAAQGRTDAGE